MEPLVSQFFPLPAAGLPVQWDVPADAALCGAELFSQILMQDPGAAAGVSSSAGLRLLLGNQLLETSYGLQ